MAAGKPQAGVRITREAQGYVADDGVRLAFGYWPGRGAPLVALHGLTASYLAFAGVAKRLTGRHALLALDLRGRGRSDLMEGLDRERIVARCRGIRVPVLMLRAPAGFVPGSPPPFSDAAMEQMCACIPEMD